ncbi:bifunctional 4-hydroxy-2-oxoglutarate aldolase/2-dehydro-3-deoxy-phosphogluconate aldolase [Nocardioides jiangxiensis]|uniref:Bifunctional 4-hydroxy-2-oxoglutarate aldolase/2-dehydro-3-deoxy-phosphogluconate aldolase n=1 Tax=Nocardioides jiangxiensis TaxID=3064524 RepID=A0ABT9AYJ1_9ACTN|nr:bifunctional 4-hydroxy-2-oxoglutarate aldolase/2-dehydro-3-deoxy-phosphogluconate aldolase [Nocardioides sp. WY-20]MDO7867413.1 bifunctional 4-hydroxy-2-oxoglutarate aldolase/2-dehydro-3-deoxy-phosphogluconate aldolase [Nocardioides sp. WY-20]
MSILSISPVIPAVVIEDPSRAVNVARALLDGGIGVVEVAARTREALVSIERIATEVPEIVVGAGTITRTAQAVMAVNAGASFIASPGPTPALLEGILETGLPYLAGCSTAGEAMQLLEHGLTEARFFPAEASGGPAYLAALAGPLPGLRFCATGGISLENAGRYLAVPNVSSVGGTWIAPADLIRAHDWAGITDRARRTGEMLVALSYLQDTISA